MVNGNGRQGRKSRAFKSGTWRVMALLQNSTGTQTRLAYQPSRGRDTHYRPDSDEHQTSSTGPFTTMGLSIGEILLAVASLAGLVVLP